MATFSKVILSSSTDGQQISVAATASGSGTAVHTAGTGSIIDEIWLYATNINTGSIQLTVEWGTSGSANEIKSTLPTTSGLTLIVPGLVLTNGKAVTAYASTANAILLSGYANRIS
jgi:hypothetical protein